MYQGNKGFMFTEGFELEFKKRWPNISRAGDTKAVLDSRFLIAVVKGYNKADRIRMLMAPVSSERSKSLTLHKAVWVLCEAWRADS